MSLSKIISVHTICRNGHGRWAVAVLFALAIASMAPGRAAAQGPGQQSAGQMSDAEKALRQRTTEFYTLLQASQVAKAENYVMKDGRDSFRTQPNAPFLSFRIVSVEMLPEGNQANEVIEMTVLSSFVGGLLPFQRNLHWQIEDGEWRLQMPAAGVVGNDSLMGMGKGLEEAAKPEELKFTGHAFGLGVLKPGEHKEIRFPFTNESNHVVKIAQIATGCDCLKNNTQKLEYKPGESGAIVLDFDSTGYEFEYAQTVVVKTDPGNIASYLLVHGSIVSKDIYETQQRNNTSPASEPPKDLQAPPMERHGSR